MYKNNKISNLERQNGVVLIWALAILLVLTVLSVSSVKLANINTQVAGNSISSMMVFQGVESTLSKTANINYVNEAAKNLPARSKDVPAADLPNEKVSGGELTSSAAVSFVGYSSCPPLDGIAMSTSASAAAGSVTCQLYEFKAQSRLRGTGAKAEHTLGTSPFVPPI